MTLIRSRILDEVIEYWQLLGYQKGSNETRSDMARKALRRGMAPEDISELTDLSIEEIEKLSQDLENDLPTITIHSR